jgi:hypothetical protein
MYVGMKFTEPKFTLQETAETPYDVFFSQKINTKKNLTKNKYQKKAL